MGLLARVGRIMEHLGQIQWNIPIRPAASAVTLSLRHATRLVVHRNS
jgi:hypothetical protein